MIPQEIQDKIKLQSIDVATKEWDWYSAGIMKVANINQTKSDYYEGAKFGYSLAEQTIKGLQDELQSWKKEHFETVEMAAETIKEKDEEIARRTAIIKKLWDAWANEYLATHERKEAWQQFKTENQL